MRDFVRCAISLHNSKFACSYGSIKDEQNFEFVRMSENRALGRDSIESRFAIESNAFGKQKNHSFKKLLHKNYKLAFKSLEGAFRIHARNFKLMFYIIN